MINMIPNGIDYTKVTTYHCTEAGVYRDKAGNKLLRIEAGTEPSVIIHQGYGMGYAMTFVEDVAEPYLSINLYQVENAHRVSDWVAFEGSGIRDWFDRYYGNFRNQIRLYKDRKIAIVISKECGDGTIKYYMPNPRNDELKKQNGWCYKWFIAHKLSTNPEFFFEVSSDEEIREHAVRGSKTTNPLWKFCNGTFSWSDLSEGAIYDDGFYSSRQFSNSLVEKLNSFFGFESAERKDVREDFLRTCPCSGQWSIKSTRKAGIVDMEALAWWIANTGDQKGLKTKAKNIQEIWKTLQFPELERQARWERRGSSIIVTALNGGGYWSSNINRVALIVDTKKGSRTLLVGPAEGEGDETGVKSLIPGIDAIHNYLRVDDRQEYDYDTRTYHAVKSPDNYIADGMSLEELFKGTIPGYVLENKDGKLADFKWVDFRTDRIISDNFEKLGGDAITGLYFSGDRIAEQLLKSNLFNLFNRYIRERADKDKRNAFFLNYNNNKDASVGIIIKKGSNLKKAFGMTMDQIRYLDSISVVKHTAKGYPRNHTGVPVTAYALGVDSLSAIDMDMFKKICFSVQSRSWNTANPAGFEAWDSLGRYSSVMDIVRGIGTVKEKIAFMEKFYSTGIGEYQDYLNMREQLIRLQQLKPEEDIFNEKDYPVVVGKTTKFIGYHPGMTVKANPHMFGYNDNVVTDEWRFTQYISWFSSVSSEKISYATDEDGVLLGALIKMDTAEHVKFLHDETARWVALYQDEHSDELFQASTLRVRKLEYSDPSTGLMIRAPRSIHELKEEGRVLSHCVASYVDPIIEGTENVMFIRRTDMPMAPYFTVDILDSGVIRQVHCYRNGDPTETGIALAYEASSLEVYSESRDILQFLRNWAAERKKVKPDTILSHYGIMGALRR